MRHATYDIRRKNALRSSEKSLLQKIKQRFGKEAGLPNPLLVHGIGDDAAVFRGSAKQHWLATSDVQVEGVHFDLNLIRMDELGERAFHVAVSDVAAMGGVPKFVLLSMVIPKRISQKEVGKLMTAFNRAAQKERVQLIGGNLSKSLSHLSLDVFVLGQVSPNKMILRSGAKPGDLIYTTGNLGWAAAGREILTKYAGRRMPPYQKLISAFLKPTARCAAGKILAESGLVTSMMDVSDGLSTDLKTLCRESSVGARIDLSQMPLAKHLWFAGKKLNRDPWQWVLHGGEDYELLFTLNSKASLAKKQMLSQKLKIPIWEIGKIIARKSIDFVDHRGILQPLNSKGWDHFAN
jgi:thiamine-monophosphate kinase